MARLPFVRIVVTCAAATALACASLVPEVGPPQSESTAPSSAPESAADAAATASTGDASSSRPPPDAAVAPGPATYTVLVAPSGATSFVPEAVTIRAGDTVRWVWEQSEHTVTSGAGGVADDRFCSPRDTGCGAAPTSNRGAVYEHVFTEPGAYPYFCRPHREMMRGSVTVAP